MNICGTIDYLFLFGYRAASFCTAAHVVITHRTVASGTSFMNTRVIFPIVTKVVIGIIAVTIKEIATFIYIRQPK